MVIYKSSSSSSFVGPLTDFLSETKRSNRPGSLSLAQVVGWTTAVGISVCVLSLFDSEHAPWNETTKFILRLVRQKMRTMVSLWTRRQKTLLNKGSENHDSQHKLVTHSGSCHCDSIFFKVVAPSVLPVQQGSGKIPYMQCRVKASNVKLIYGGECLRVYHYQSKHTTIAYSFCQNCATHICNASEDNVSTVAFNVNCLRKDTVERLQPQSNEEVKDVSKIREEDRRVVVVSRKGSYGNSDLASVVEENEDLGRDGGDSPPPPTMEVVTPTRTLQPERWSTPTPPTKEWEWPNENDSVFSGATEEFSSTDLSSLDGGYVSTTSSTETRDKLRHFMLKHLKSSSSSSLSHDKA